MTARQQLALPLPPDQAPAWLEALIERHLDLAPRGGAGRRRRDSSPTDHP